MSSTCPHNMVNFGLLTAEIHPVVWGTPANVNGFRVLAALLHGAVVVGVSQTLRRWQRAPPIFGRAPSRWELAHISSYFYFLSTVREIGWKEYLRKTNFVTTGMRDLSPVSPQRYSFWGPEYIISSEQRPVKKSTVRERLHWTEWAAVLCCSTV